MSDAFDLDDMPSFGQRPRRQRRSAPWANGLSFGAEPENEEQEIETDQSDLEKIAGGRDRMASVRAFAERPPVPSPLADQLKQDAQTLNRGQDGEDFQKSVRAHRRLFPPSGEPENGAG